MANLTVIAIVALLACMFISTVQAELIRYELIPVELFFNKEKKKDCDGSFASWSSSVSIPEKCLRIGGHWVNTFDAIKFVTRSNPKRTFKIDEGKAPSSNQDDSTTEFKIKVIEILDKKVN